MAVEEALELTVLLVESVDKECIAAFVGISNKALQTSDDTNELPTEVSDERK